MVECPTCHNSIISWTCGFCNATFESDSIPTNCLKCNKQWIEAHCNVCYYTFYDNSVVDRESLYSVEINQTIRLAVQYDEGNFFRDFSLLRYGTYNPEFLKKLEEKLIEVDDSGRKLVLKPPSSFILNLMDKLGNVEYSCKLIKQFDGTGIRSHIFVRHYVSYSIISAKACLDSLANILNWVYELGLKGGKIDLSTRRTNLVQKLMAKNAQLSEQLSKFQSFIDEITGYRDVMVHRQMVITSPVFLEGAKIDSSVQPSKNAIPKFPLWMKDQSDDLQQRSQLEFFTSEVFCQWLTEQLHTLVQLVMEDLLLQLETGVKKN
jgi:plasmid maintenance system killer protein